ncbi:MAG: PAS domain S-box protein [Lysobacter sp.]|nr:PAS domain S-box protein [Lysobacter sp.]
MTQSFPGSPAGAAQESGRSRRLLWFGMALAVALPLLAVWLLVHDRREQQDLAAERSQLLVRAVQRQTAERLELLSRDLSMHAAGSGQFNGADGTHAGPVSTIPLTGVRVQRIDLPSQSLAPAGHTGLQLGPPVRQGTGWAIPVHQDERSGLRVSGQVDAAWFAGIVQGYELAENEMLDLVHADRVLIARSQDNVANTGRAVDKALLFQPPHLDQMQGRYVGRSVVDGVTRQFVFGRMPGTPLIAVASAPQSAILLPWYAFAAVVLGMSLAMGALWIWLMRLLARSQKRQDTLVRELRQTSLRLRQAHALAAIGEYEWDLQTDRVRWSPQIFAIYGRRDGGALLDSRQALDWVDPRDAQAVEASLEQLICGGNPGPLEFRIHRPDGEVRWMQARGTMIEEADGRRYVRGIQQDVTELAQVRERLREAEAQYRFLFEHNPMPMWVYDRDTLRLLAVNETATAKYGYSRDEFLSMTVLDIRPEQDRRRALAYIRNPPWPNEDAEHWRHVLKDGQVIHVNNTGIDIDFDGRPACLVLIRDITRQRQAEAERQRSEERFRLIARATSDAVYDLDTEHDTLWWGDSFYSTFGFSREEIPATLTAWEALVHPDDVARVSGSLQAAMDSNVSEWEEEYRFRCSDGRYAEVVDRGYLLRDASGGVTRVVGGMLDVSERHRSEADLRLLRRAVEATSNGIIITDARQPDCPVVYVNPAFQEITGYTPEEVIGRNCRFLQREDRDQIALESIRQAMREQREVRVLLRNYRKDGTPFANEFHVAPVRDGSGALTHFVGVQNDVTQRQRYEEQLAYRATHDELTGLPNRQLLLDRLQQAVLSAERYGREIAVMFIDLDDFKLVNDSLGHSAGDDVLRVVARRLQEVVRGTDTVGRFGGDEFVIVLAEQTDAAGIAEVLARVTRELTDPIELAGVSYTLTPSIGYCRYPEAGRDAEALLMRADVAMYQAKQQGRNRAVAYRPEFDHAISQRLQLVSQLRDALRREEFVLDFQPLFGIDDQPVALEALVRWHHPDRGVLLPDEFVAVCEESGLIVELGRRVLAEAARHHALLTAAGFGHLRIAVNVSAAQFAQDLHADIVEVMTRYALPRGVLELELTESVVMASPERAIRSMQQIVTLGVAISIDDFGTGYSSLAYLKRLPIERLKIDRSFVRDLGVHADDALICSAIIALAHSLRLSTVAEGVETIQQHEWLRSRGCDELQGFLLGRPQPFKDVLKLLQTGSTPEAPRTGIRGPPA